jgi:Fe-S-cluster formation regulator IscX/YfhJ
MISYEDWENAILKKVFIPKEDLKDTEKDILKHSYDIFISRIADLKAFDDDVKRLNEKVLNLKTLNEELIKDLEEIKNKKNE